MKINYYLFVLIILSSCSSAKDVTGKTLENGNLMEQGISTDPWGNLNKIPTGFEVLHSPKTVKDYKTDEEGWPFKWNFKTTIKNISSKDITIFSFGIMAWENGKWIIDQEQEKYNSGILNSNVFTEWYNCPNGIIKSNQTYSDNKNWAGNYQLKSFKQKWVYLGKDKNGNIYKGESIVHLEK